MKFINKYLGFAIPFAIIIYSVVINKFPDGYIYTSGDYAQPVNIKYVFEQIFYVWGNKISAIGEGGFQSWFAAIPYYLVFYRIPDILNFTGSQTLSFILFLFLCLSYISFYFAAKSLSPGNYIFLKYFSLLYAFNLTTLYFYEYTWGFSHHIFLYITIPILFTTFYKSLKEPTLRNFSFYILSLVISISGFANAAFFGAFVLYSTLFVLFQILQGTIKLNKITIILLAQIAVLSIFAISYWILPMLSFAIEGIKDISMGKVFNSNDWLRSQSANITSILIGNQNYKIFYPFKYGAKLFYLFALTPIILFIYLLKNQKKLNKENSSIIVSFLGILGVFVLLIKKSSQPFGELTLSLFQFQPLMIFRSYEKLAIFIPFTILLGIYILLSNNKVSRNIAIVFITVMLLAPTPFFIGGIQKKYSITFPSSSNYRSANYSSLVSIPKDYYIFANDINNKQTDLKIQSLPYSPLNSVAWVNYPKWKLIGLNPSDNLLEKPVISQNASIFLLQSWNPAADFNTMKENPIWYTKMLSMFAIDTIIYHKDVSQDFITLSEPKLQKLVNLNTISLRNSYELFDTYNLNDNYQSPSIYIPLNEFILNGDLQNLPHALLLSEGLNKFAFTLSDKMPVASSLTYYSILNPIKSVDNINLREWDKEWTWPEEKEILDPFSTFQRLRNKTLGTYLDKFNSKNTSELDIALFELSKDALTINKYDLYENDELMTNFNNKAKKIPEYFINNNNPKLNEINKSIIYLSKIKNIMGDYWGDNEQHILYLNSIYEKTSSCPQLMNYCFEFNVNKPETFEFYIPKSAIALEYIGDELPNLLTFNIDGVEQNQIPSTSNKYEDYIYLGKYTINRNTILRLNLENHNLISKENWENSIEVNELNTNEYSISMKSISFNNPVYKKINDLKPLTAYKLSFEYFTNYSDIEIGILENNILLENEDTKFNLGEVNSYESFSMTDEIKASPKNNSNKDKTWIKYEKSFKTNDLISGGYLVIASNAENAKLGTANVRNIKIEKILEPIIIAKRSTTSTKKIYPNISYTKKSPTKYELAISNSTISNKYPLILSELYDKGWKIRKRYKTENALSIIQAIIKNDFLFQDSHHMVNGYSNSWNIDQSLLKDTDNKLIIEFIPQGYFYIGAFITILVSIGSICIIIFKKAK